MRMRFLFSGLLSLALAACGGGAAPDEPTASPARVEILDGAALLTEAGQTRALSARVLDSQGREITATVAWESSRPDSVGVSVNGELIAQGTGGVSQITARVGNLRSAPMLALHTPVAAGAVLLTDEQIVGEPEESSPGAAPSASNIYRVRLSGVAAPAVGDLLVNTGGKVVVGRVLAVQSADGVQAVTLGLLPLREVFPQLRIDEVIDLAQAEATVPADVLQNYEVQREGSTYRFTPKPGVAAPAAVMRPSSQRATSAAVGPVSGTVALPPFKKCEATLEGAGGAGSLPVKLSKLPSFSLDFNPKLHTRYTPETGLERMVVSSDATFTADTSLEFSAGFDGKLTCTIELVVVRIPVGGPVAAFLGGLVTLGAGVELSGKVTLPGAKLSNTYERKNTLELGVACAPGCSLVNTLSDAQVKHTADIQGPDLNDLRIEPSVFGYGLAQLAVGNPFLTSLRFNAFYGKLGVAYQTSLASREAQIARAGYQSNYQLAALFKGGLETDFGQLAAWLGFNGVAENLIELSAPLATSPSGTLTFDRSSFAAGDPVTATVNFDTGSSRFLTLYNIDAVVLVRKTGSDPAREIARVRPTQDGQTRLSIPFTADSAGTDSELHAFVLTRALPLELAALELGRSRAGVGLQGTVDLDVTDLTSVRDAGLSSDSQTRMILSARLEERDGVLMLLDPSGSVVRQTNSTRQLEFFIPGGERKCNVDFSLTITNTLAIPITGGESGLSVIGSTVINAGMTILRGTITIVTRADTTVENYNNEGDSCEGYVDGTTEVTSIVSGQMEVLLSKSRPALFQAEATTDGTGIRRLQVTDAWTDANGSAAIHLDLSDAPR